MAEWQALYILMTCSKEVGSASTLSAQVLRSDYLGLTLFSYSYTSSFLGLNFYNFKQPFLFIKSFFKLIHVPPKFSHFQVISISFFALLSYIFNSSVLPTILKSFNAIQGLYTEITSRITQHAILRNKTKTFIDYDLSHISIQDFKGNRSPPREITLAWTHLPPISLGASLKGRSLLPLGANSFL